MSMDIVNRLTMLCMGECKAKDADRALDMALRLYDSAVTPYLCATNDVEDVLRVTDKVRTQLVACRATLGLIQDRMWKEHEDAEAELRRMLDHECE